MSTGRMLWRALFVCRTCQYAVAKALLGTGENERLDDMVPLKRIMIHEWHPLTPNSNQRV